jgi:hypothetical protein
MPTKNSSQNPSIFSTTRLFSKTSNLGLLFITGNVLHPNKEYICYFHSSEPLLMAFDIKTKFMPIITLCRPVTTATVSKKHVFIFRVNSPSF